MILERFVVDPRYCGPPGIANGGYLAGRLARTLRGAVEVTLRAAAPLGKTLDVTESPKGGRVLRDGDVELATEIPVPLEIECPKPPSFEEAVRIEGTCRALRTHPFPRCFVCGPERVAGDGLRIFPGPLRGGRAAAPWIRSADLGDDSGLLAPELVWAALDCTSAFPLLEDEEARRLEPMVLGRLTVDIRRRVRANRPHVVLAWKIGLEGRRGQAGAALYDDEGPLGVARATWISIARTRSS